MKKKYINILKSNPYFLARKICPAHHGKFCIPKPKLGSEFIPDFFTAGLDSAGLWWYGIELENPNKSMFRKDGECTSTLSHALRQIHDWRGWLRQNVRYAQEALGFTYIDADLPCYIIIGKRQNEALDINTLNSRRREINLHERVFLHHYEWLLDEQRTLVKVSL